MSRTEAVEALYQDMAARHRSRFRSIHVCRHPSTTVSSSLTIPPDHQGRRGREVRGRPPPLHQAAPQQEPQVPPSPPHSQDCRQEGLRCPPPRHLLLSASLLIACYCWFRNVSVCRLQNTIQKLGEGFDRRTISSPNTKSLRPTKFAKLFRNV